MANYEIGRFVEGTVRAYGWWYPRGGQRVWLASDGDARLTVNAVADGISYTWPRGKDNQTAARLAVRHYERRTGRNAFGGSDARPYYSAADMGYSDSGEPISR